MEVNFVSSIDDKIIHYIKQDPLVEMKDRHVNLKLDKERRLQHAKSHTAGHLLSAVVESLASELKGTKGHHFPDGPYVEFNGKLIKITKGQFFN